MKKILCVLRTSTIRQEIDSQKSDMVNYLLSKGYSEEEIEWLISKGASARKANQEYLEMLETIKGTILSTPTIKCVAVWHLNRLGRKGKYLDEMKNWFIDNHIQLLCKTPQMQLLNDDGTYNIANNIIFSVYSATIEGDTQETMDKLTRGKNFAKSQGKYVGGWIPFGFKVEDHKMVVDDSQMELVRLIFNEYSTGKYSYYSLSEELLSRGFNFTIRHLHLLISKEIYKDYVGKELWEKCQEVREGNTLKTKETTHCHLALKLIKCPYCGQSYIADTNHYVCLAKKHSKRLGISCPDSISVKGEVVDTLLRDIAYSEHINFLMNNREENKKEYSHQIEVLREKIQHLESESERIISKEDRIKELYIEGAINRDTYNSKLQQNKVEFEKNKADIWYLENEIGRLEGLISNLTDDSFNSFLELVRSVNKIDRMDEIRDIIRQHIKKVEVRRTEFNDRQATLITIYPYDGEIREFIYDYNCDKRGTAKDFIKKIFYKDGTRYSYSGESIERIIKNIK